MSAKPWSMVDEVTKAQRSGVSLHYMMTESLKPKVNSEDGELGYTVMKESIPVDAAKALADVPGIYDAEFILRGRAGKNVLSICGVEFISVVE